MRVEFDPAKNEKNIRERGLSFELAADFDFSTAVIAEDSRKDYSEGRFVALGYVGSRLHVRCFTPRNGGIRVISFRKANDREVKRYAKTKGI